MPPIICGCLHVCITSKTYTSLDWVNIKFSKDLTANLTRFRLSTTIYTSFFSTYWSENALFGWYLPNINLGHIRKALIIVCLRTVDESVKWGAANQVGGPTQRLTLQKLSALTWNRSIKFGIISSSVCISPISQSFTKLSLPCLRLWAVNRVINQLLALINDRLLFLVWVQRSRVLSTAAKISSFLLT